MTFQKEKEETQERSYEQRFKDLEKNMKLFNERAEGGYIIGSDFNEALTFNITFTSLK